MESSQEDFEFFVQFFGAPIKKFSLNGLFQQVMDRFDLASFAIYDALGSLIENQPVEFPESGDPFV
ncbi:forkhead box protein [Algoriphagus hitonicola]|uniref:Uncharacterized protein n=1 Tax=Algoriphagus hitonicola TaxID=435880 RepID=A0A1I2QT99_9BACT|nr:hypothetical protein [Algoriphagus hitonicola]SFG30883.1 hypothetical protein SAMN04487988_102407 [Algoriphagus hitonicola]